MKTFSTKVTILIQVEANDKSDARVEVRGLIDSIMGSLPTGCKATDTVRAMANIQS